MKRKIILISALVALLAIPMVVNAAVDKYRYDNTQAWVYWTQVDAAKNGKVAYQFGSASVYQYDDQFEGGVYADAYITDVVCPVGVDPWGGWDEEAYEDPCTYKDRWGYSDDATIEIIGKKLTGARISGTFHLYRGETGMPAGTKSLSAELTGIGSTWTSQGMWRDRYQGGMSMYRDRWVQREATVVGSFGGMTFQADSTGAGFGTSTGFSLWKSR